MIPDSDIMLPSPVCQLVLLLLAGRAVADGPRPAERTRTGAGPPARGARARPVTGTLPRSGRRRHTQTLDGLQQPVKSRCIAKRRWEKG